MPLSVRFPRPAACSEEETPRGLEVIRLLARLLAGRAKHTAVVAYIICPEHTYRTLALVDARFFFLPPRVVVLRWTEGRAREHGFNGYRRRRFPPVFRTDKHRWRRSCPITYRLFSPFLPPPPRFLAHGGFHRERKLCSSSAGFYACRERETESGGLRRAKSSLPAVFLPDFVRSRRPTFTS